MTWICNRIEHNYLKKQERYTLVIDLDFENTPFMKKIKTNFLSDLKREFGLETGVSIIQNKLKLKVNNLNETFIRLRNIWPYQFSLEIPLCLYVLKKMLMEKLKIIEDETNTNIILNISHNVFINASGAEYNLAIAKCKIYKLIDYLMGRSGIISWGVFSYKQSHLKDKKLFFASKIDSKYVYFSRSHYLESCNNFITKYLDIENCKYNFLILYKRMKIENLCSISDCYIESIPTNSNYSKLKITGNEFSIQKFIKNYKEMSFSILKISVKSVTNTYKFLNELENTKEIIFFVNDDYSISNNFKNKLNITNLDNEESNDNNTIEYLKDNNILGHYKDNNDITEDYRYNNSNIVIFGEFYAIKKVLKSSIFELYLEIELNKEIEDFLCGKKNGKINKIIKESNCKLVFDSFNDDKQRILLIYGVSYNVLIAIKMLRDEYPTEISFNLDERYHKKIIGYGGKNIQKIMKKHGVYIKFMNAEEKTILGYEKNVIIKTPKKNEDSLQKMKDEILENVDYEQNEIEMTNKVSLLDFYDYKYPIYEFYLDYVKIPENPKKIYYYKTDSKKGDEIIELIDGSKFIKSYELEESEVIDSVCWIDEPLVNFLTFKSQLYYTYESKLKSLICSNIITPQNSDNPKIEKHLDMDLTEKIPDETNFNLEYKKEDKHRR